MRQNNTKTFFIYFLFILVSLIIAGLFITSTSYMQLAIATLLYPPIIYFAFRSLPARTGASANSERIPVNLQPAKNLNQQYNSSLISTNSNSNKQSVELIDIDKRAFLKLIGAAGFTFFLFSALSRKIEDVILDKTTKSIDPNNNATTMSIEGYKISEIDSDEFGYYGFINKIGNWYIMKEDPTTGSYRYVKGESNFTLNWKDRGNLKFDYFNNVFN